MPVPRRIGALLVGAWIRLRHDLLPALLGCCRDGLIWMGLAMTGGPLPTAAPPEQSSHRAPAEPRDPGAGVAGPADGTGGLSPDEQRAWTGIVHRLQ